MRWRNGRESLGRVCFWAVLLFLVVTFPMDLTRQPEVVTTLAALGYPAYLATILGTAKVLAGLAILQQRWQRAKDWAASGLGIMFIGAMVSHAHMQSVLKAAAPFGCLVMLAVAYGITGLSRKTPAGLWREHHA